MVGVVGSDFGDEHFALLHSRNIDTKGVQMVEEEKPSAGQAVITTT